jgi:hypothetical protein
MSNLYYPQQTLKIMIAFADMFNKTKFPIYKSDGTVESQKIIPLEISGAEKLLMKLQKYTNFNSYLPRMGIHLDSLDPDEDKIRIKDFKLLSADNEEWVFHPIAYNFNLTLSIIAEKSTQLFLIMEQIISTFRMTRYYPFIEWKFTDGTVIKRDLPVTLSANAIEINDELSLGDKEAAKVDLTFVCKNVLYTCTNNGIYNKAGMPSDVSGGNSVDGGIIKTIDISFEEYVINTYNEYTKWTEDYTITEDTGGEITIS